MELELGKATSRPGGWFPGWLNDKNCPSPHARSNLVPACDCACRPLRRIGPAASIACCNKRIIAAPTLPSIPATDLASPECRAHSEQFHSAKCNLPACPLVS